MTIHAAVGQIYGRIDEDSCVVYRVKEIVDLGSNGGQWPKRRRDVYLEPVYRRARLRPRVLSEKTLITGYAGLELLQDIEAPGPA